MSSRRSPIDASRKRRVGILGGGICGLTAAYRLTKLQPDWEVKLFESSDRLGGVLSTVEQDGYLIERSADNFIANPAAPWARRLCEEIGFSDQIIPTNEAHRRAVIWLNGHLHPIPNGFQLMKANDIGAVFTSKLLSLPGKIRLAAEPFVATKPAGENGNPNRVADESLTSFATRRLGAEAFERLVQPLVSGIYTADADKLSMNAALPQFVKMEQTSGSLSAAMQPGSKSGSGARYNQFWAPRHGLSSMIKAIAAQLPPSTVVFNRRVTAIEQVDSKWQLSFSPDKHEQFDGVVSCLPAPIAGQLTANLNADLASDLRSIEHASSTVVCLGYAKKQFSRPLKAFGCVVPIIAGRRVIAISFSSMKYPGRATDNDQLLRVFLGGALQPEYACLDDIESTKLAKEEVETILGVHGEPNHVSVHRWKETMPQYHVGHLDKVDSIRRHVAKMSAFEIESNALDGVGIPQRIKSGEEAARRIAEQLTANNNGESI